MRTWSTLFFLLVMFIASGQKNFSYTPAHPKPGDVISFTYEPAGNIANTLAPVEAAVFQLGSKTQKADDLVLTRKAGKFTGSVVTDTSMNFLYFSFSSDNKFDNNFNDGYFINLYENEQPRRGSFYNQSVFYQFYTTQAGGERNPEKAIAAMEKEFSLYPDNRKAYLYGYLRLVGSSRKEEAPALIQSEIEALLKEGLNTENDYATLESLYELAKLKEQARLIAGLKKERFPDGNWTVNDQIEKFNAEKDIEKKKALLAEITKNVDSGKEKWQWVKNNLNWYKLRIAGAFFTAKNFEKIRPAVEELGVTDKNEIASAYNNYAWEMQGKGEGLAVAEELSRFATETAKNEWKNPSGPKPDFYTGKQWARNREYIYAMYADTYGMVMYRLGHYKKGLPFAREAALVIQKGKDAEQNNTYALLAEKALPVKEYKKELEQFVKDGKATQVIKDILRRAYVKQKKSDAGFEDYITALQKESQLKMMEELRKSMKNETAPSFALLDLSGNKVSTADLKGKVVVVDFWATWCGPCKASFPGMQKMVDKYKDDPGVKFLFVDTWERCDNKEKNAADFISANKYSFQVLMDKDDKVVEDYKVDGIPTKFVLDKEGKIRFKSVGFDGSDDKLVDELTAMIEMAAEPFKKAF